MVSLEEIMEEVYRLDYAEFDNAPKHFFSRRHRKAIKEIIYPNIKSESAENRNDGKHIPIKKRVIIVLMVIILSIFGITAGASISRGFIRKEYRDHIVLYSINAEKAPETIEYVYYLPVIPDEYEPFKQISDSWLIYESYIDPDTNNVLVFDQTVKEGYKVYLDNEHQTIEEIEINGKYALYFESEYSGGIIWDNEDYILEISGSFTKDELIEMAQSIQCRPL